MSRMTPVTSRQDYALGHSDAELNRLIDQGRFLGDISEQILRLAGISAGMRVLDVGSGPGDLSFLAARMVGPGGEVIGVDRSEDAVRLAEQRAAAAGLTNVRFSVADITDFTDLGLEEPVDAVIGRLILMYCPDPSAVVRNLAGLVKPGGIVCFQDFDLFAPKSVPPVELFDLTMERMRQAFSSSGANLYAGLRLGQIMEAAGLPPDETILGARTGWDANSPAYEQVAMVTRSLLPIIERAGIATAEEIDIDTLADRLRAETLAAGATLVSPSLIGAWTRLPASAP